jgi:hypothetical protein
LEIRVKVAIIQRKRSPKDRCSSWLEPISESYDEGKQLNVNPEGIGELSMSRGLGAEIWKFFLNPYCGFFEIEVPASFALR